MMMQHNFESVHWTGADLAGIAATTESVSISLLAAIDGTVDAMNGITSVMTGLCKVLSACNDHIKSLDANPGDYIDPDGIAVDAMASAASSMQNFLTKLVVKRSAIDRDSRLKDHHCEALHDSYEDATGAVAELVEMILDARASLITHDLAAEPRDTTPFKSIEDLIDNLRQA
ncbi:hypothetical protein [Azonexus sp. IMCC34839]|uniref:hypothetical protein n=1 Tax=Azonexus sp. IMCC34839 TaxID=3133695 RepID=UPI00399A576E